MRNRDIEILELFLQLTEDEREDALAFAKRLADRGELIADGYLPCGRCHP